MVEKRKHFMGKLFVTKKGKEWTAEERHERNIEKTHLRAYLRGDTRFTHKSFGFDKHLFTVYRMVNFRWA